MKPLVTLRLVILSNPLHNNYLESEMFINCIPCLCSQDIQSILVPSSAEKSLLRRIIEEEDVDDVVVNSWTKCVNQEKPICFEEMFKQDMAIRLGEEAENEVNQETLAIEGVVNAPATGLVELVQSIKKDVEEGLKKMNDKFDGLESRLVEVESYVKEQLDARRMYEDPEYNLNDNHAYEAQDVRGGDNDGGIIDKVILSIYVSVILSISVLECLVIRNNT